MADRKRTLARSTEDPLVLLAQIDQEDPSPLDLETLRMALCTEPDLWRTVGDLVDQAVLEIVKNLNANPVAREFVKANYEGQKRDLGYESAPPLERMLIQQVALTWLRLQILEQHYTQSTMTTANPLTRETGDFWDRRLSAAQRRHLRACETLARIRKMGIAAVQVNIADQQVNIAGGS